MQAASTYATVANRLASIESQLVSRSQMDSFSTRLDVLEKIFVLVDWHKLEDLVDRMLGGDAVPTSHAVP